MIGDVCRGRRKDERVPAPVVSRPGRFLSFCHIYNSLVTCHLLIIHAGNQFKLPSWERISGVVFRFKSCMLSWQREQCGNNARPGSCRREWARLSQPLQTLFSCDSGLHASCAGHKGVLPLSSAVEGQMSKGDPGLGVVWVTRCPRRS